MSDGCCLPVSYISNKIEMRFTEIWNSQLSVLVGKRVSCQIYLKLSVEFVSMGDYDFPCQCDGPWNSHFFKLPVVGTD
jgi:hypothetical protein